MKQVLNKILLFLLIVLNLFFFKESLVWFYKVILGLHDLFNTVFFFLLLFLIYKNTSIKHEVFCFSYRLFPLVICSLSVFGYYLSESFIQINILSFIFLLLYLFGLLGFFIPKKKWKKYLIPFFLIMMMLPFGSILDLYIGFPLRIASVNLVSVFFEFLDVDHLSADTIITIENNSSQVDFSCSGIKGLWAASVFYITNTWLKGYRINFRWLLVGGILMTLILLLNTIRILILVYFDLVLILPRVSDVIHVPLGLFGFVFSCVITYFLSDYLLQTKTPEFFIKPEINHVYYFSNMFILLPLLQIVLCLRTSQHEAIKQDRSKHYFENDFLEYWSFNSVNLSNEETKFMEVHGGQLDKFHFYNEVIKGNGFVLKSKTWRSHHSPEYCITSGGREIVKSETLKMNSSNTIKSIVLSNGQQGYYWFQHNAYTTDDFGTRVWQELFYQKRDWFLVCLIFNSNKNLDQKERFIKKITTQLKSKI